MLITKASGEKSPFVKKKFIGSLQRSGLTTSQAKEIVSQVDKDLYPEITSEQIYQKTHRVLKKTDKTLAAKYSLKRAIMHLGPSGWYFERYMAAVLSAYGYHTKYNQFLYGKCVQHEIDIVAERQGKKYMIECKYHNQVGARSDVKVALYVYARFLDLKAKHKFDEAVLVTNTRFTTEAVRYAECMGVKVIGWHHPNPKAKESLEHYIESKKLYPITVLPSLTKHLSQQFRDSNVVLVYDLLNFSSAKLAKKFRIKEPLAIRLIEEAQNLVG